MNLKKLEMKYYSNPKHNEYMRDEQFVRDIMKSGQSQERKDIVQAILSVLFAGIIFLMLWFAIMVLEG